MTGYVLLVFCASVPTLAVFFATFAFLRVRRENDKLREEIEALRARVRAYEADRWEAAQMMRGDNLSEAVDGGEEHGQ